MSRQITPGKRLFDTALAALLAILLAPVIVSIAIALLLSQGRPILFRSERMKTPDQPFDLWKFRTMRPGTDDGTGVSGGDKTDRITPLGHVLRRTRADELPQLYNILRGDLSVVGPRPPLRSYVDRFPELYAQVLQSRPGVTGLATLVFAQHEARLLAKARTPHETDAIYVRRCIPRKARLDLIYAKRRSLLLDLRIIARTLRLVLTR